ncbi:hypothetical protein J4423_00960 [Candidatus Pacearchaeota archaeon]|nr:hypothetical protein [Candidatus Pacearchaeota archaeon]
MSEKENSKKETQEVKEISEKEKRVRAITKLYYSNPKVQEVLLEFSKNREVVPRYFESFGKRPDTLQYTSDIMGLVNKGATSFHASEEIWHNPLEINSDMSSKELENMRKSWDLLIDIDSPFIDYSKIAAILLIEELEKHGIKSYRTKYSGSKGFHLIVPAKAFPENFNGIETRKMFPEWPRAIVQYLMIKIKPKFSLKLKEQEINFEAVKERMNLSEEDLLSIQCPNCSKAVNKTNFVEFACDKCGNPYSRPDFKITKKRLRCTDESCSGFLEIRKVNEEYLFCNNCKTKLSLNNDIQSNTRNKIQESRESRGNLVANEFKENLKTEEIAPLDLVLVAPRHLFRMPYSLHEKTALASIVLNKEELISFTPKSADPLKVNIKPFYIEPSEPEATNLLTEALKWKLQNEPQETEKRISEEFIADFTGVTEEMFPQAIKKLLKGLQEGRKRGLFILLTFLKSLDYPNDYISQKINDWNKKNDPPLKDGYVKSQLDWHFKQKKKILPPNYNNDSFYKDLKLIDQKPSDKNPLVEVMRKLRKSKGNFE